MKTTILPGAALLAAGLAAAPGARAQDAPAPTRPNILFIAVDDLKPLLGCYGDTTVKTPNIDRLAARGVLFERAYCNQAVCAPSRNALMTGLRPQTLGIYDLGTNFRRALPDAVTFPQQFMKAGYHTAALGKIMHVGHGNREDAASWTVPHVGFGPQYARPETAADFQRQIREAREKGLAETQIANTVKGPATESADVPDNGYGDGKTADEAVKRLREAGDKPFILAVGFLKPHLPFCAPKKYWDMYDPAKFSLATPQTPPEGAPSYAPQFGGELRNYAGIPKQGRLPDDLQRHLIHGYHAAVSYTDAQIGKVLDALDASGQAKNTIVVLWGDHGWHLGDHGMWAKHTNYEHAARIPLIVAAPGMKAGVKSSSLVETVDLYPTLCELAGVPAPSGLEGTSFVPILKDPAARTKDSIIHVYPRGERLGRAVRTDRYRLVEWKKPGDPVDTAVYELYDYRTDPMETKNLASEQAAVVSQLKAILAGHPEPKPQIKVVSASPSANASAKPATDRNALFDRRDTNRDGKLTLEEFLQGQPDPDEAPKRFPLFDADKDGVLSREEFVMSGNVKK